MTDDDIYAAVMVERARQVRRFGDENVAGPGIEHTDRISILAEEVGELAKEVNDLRYVAMTPEDRRTALRRAMREAEQVTACGWGTLLALAAELERL